jgi:hypothetical protein
MAKALAMSNAATLITPEMKDDLQNYKSNNISNYKKRRIFGPPNNNRRLDWRSPNSDSSSYQSGFTAGQGSNPSFFPQRGREYWANPLPQRNSRPSSRRSASRNLKRCKGRGAERKY